MPPKNMRRLSSDNTLNIISKATEGQVGADIYSNYAHITATLNEFVFDFYRVMPSFDNKDSPKALHVQRVIVPANTAKGFISALNEIVKTYEQEIGIDLQDQRDTPPASIAREPKND